MLSIREKKRRGMAEALLMMLLCFPGLSLKQNAQHAAQRLGGSPE